MLNKIWGGFFFIAFAVGLIKTFRGDSAVWAAMVSAAFDLAKIGFEIALGLTGVMCLWLGLMKLGEKGGAIDLLAKAFGPLLRRLFPGIPEGHPATGSIVMNMAANMLGLDNAARMNYPSKPSGNWQWRLRPEQLTQGIKDRLTQLNRTYRRDAWRDPDEPVEVTDYLDNQAE